MSCTPKYQLCCGGTSGSFGLRTGTILGQNLENKSSDTMLTRIQFYGRRPIYVTSFVFFVIWLIPCAVARNIQTMLIARFLDGLAGSAFLSVAGGTVGDMFSRNELQGPMMVFLESGLSSGRDDVADCS